MVVQGNTIAPITPPIAISSDILAFIGDFAQETTQDTIPTKEALKQAISLTGENTEKWSKIIQCESGWNVEAIGDHGKAVGILQFHLPTFNRYKDKYGLTWLEYNNPYDQILLAEIMVRDSSLNFQHWTCSSNN